ncbi:MAG: GAF domain-containing protein [Anaerolineae bacterium]
MAAGAGVALVGGNVTLGGGGFIFLTLASLYVRSPVNIGVMTIIYIAVIGLALVGPTTMLAPQQAVSLMLFPLFIGVSMLFVSAQLSQAFIRLERRTRGLEFLSEDGQMIASVIGLDETIHEVVSRARERFDVDTVRVYVVDESESYVLRASAHRQSLGTSDPTYMESEPDSLTGSLLTTRESVVRSMAGQQQAAFPLQVGRSLLGVLEIRARRGVAFSDHEISTFNTLASQLAIAIDNARQLGTEAAMLEATSPIFRATQGITTSTNPDTILEVLRETVLRTADRLSLAGVTFGEGGRPVVTVLSSWDRNGLQEEEVFPEPVRAAIRNNETIVDDASTVDQSALRDYARHILRARSFAIIPLTGRDRTVGYLVVAYYDTHTFTESEVRTLRSVAGQVAVVLDNLTLLDTLSQQAERLALINEVAEQAISAETVADLGQAVLNALRSALDITYLSFSRPDRAGTVRVTTLLEGRQTAADMLRLQGRLPSGRILLEGTTLARIYDGEPTIHETIEPNTSGDGDWLPNYVQGLMVVPLETRGSLIGTLNIGLPRAADLTLQRLVVVERIASIFGSSLERTTAVEDMRRSLDEANVLYNTTLAVNAAQAVDEVYETALTEIANVSGGRRLTLYLAGPDPRVETTYVAEVAVLDGDRLAVTNAPVRYPLDEAPIMAQFPQTRANLVFNNARQDPRLAAALREDYRKRDVSAVMLVPISTGATWLGAVIVEGYDGLMFDPDRTRLSRSIADQTAVALDSHILLERSKSAVDRERALRDVAERIRTASDPQDVMTVAAEEIAQVLGVTPDEAAVISMRDSQRQALNPADRELIEGIASQVDLALQNLALLEAAEQAALREQMINEMTAEIQRSTSVDEVMRTAVRVVNEQLRDYDIVLRLAPDSRDQGGPAT